MASETLLSRKHFLYGAFLVVGEARQRLSLTTGHPRRPKNLGKKQDRDLSEFALSSLKYPKASPETTLYKSGSTKGA